MTLKTLPQWSDYVWHSTEVTKIHNRIRSNGLLFKRMHTTDNNRVHGPTDTQTRWRCSVKSFIRLTI